MCVDTIDSFEKSCNTTPGAKGKIYIELEKFVKTITKPDPATSHEIDSDIVFKTIVTDETVRDGVFSEWPISVVPGKFALNSPLEGDADSAMHAHSITAFIPGSDAATSLIVKGVKNQPCIVIYEDKDGQMQLIGDVDDGAEVKVEEVNEQGSRGHNVTINWYSKDPLYFYTGAVTA